MAKISTYSTDVSVSGTDKLIGTDADSSNATKNYTVQSIADYVVTSSVPSTSSSTGRAGQIAYDSTYIYICVATDTWKRVILSTF